MRVPIQRVKCLGELGPNDLMECLGVQRPKAARRHQPAVCGFKV